MTCALPGRAEPAAPDAEGLGPVGDERSGVVGRPVAGADGVDGVGRGVPDGTEGAAGATGVAETSGRAGGDWTMAATAKPPTARVPAAAREASAILGQGLAPEDSRWRTGAPDMPRSTRARIRARSGWWASAAARSRLVSSSFNGSSSPPQRCPASVRSLSEGVRGNGLGGTDAGGHEHRGLGGACRRGAAGAVRDAALRGLCAGILRPSAAGTSAGGRGPAQPRGPSTRERGRRVSLRPCACCRRRSRRPPAVPGP